MTKSVMIIGGGIAGIQAALDLAEKGIEVDLVEKLPSIGGRMAQLDKTFPTNDCSICILAPKMADCYAHPSINVMTYSEIKDISGEAGDFKVDVLKKARFVDEEKCNGCGDCFKVCPVSLPNEFDMGMRERPAIYVPFLQSVPRAATIDRAGVAPCSDKCPAGLSAQGYVALIRAEKFKEAVDLIRRTIPLPSVCGRICHHPCEEGCNRTDVDDPVAIAGLKAFVGDYVRQQGEDVPTPIEEERKEKVAVVGAGPAGLAAAYRLALKGFKVKMFEATSKPGGMLWWGIPDYRLPKDVLTAEVDYLLAHGVEIEYGKTVGKDLALEDLKKEYDAVFLAIGAHKSLKLGVPGEDLEGVVHGVDFLHRVADKETVKIGKKVAVIGGGNAAMDAARTALRMGSDVTVIYRRTKDEMPAIGAEIKGAEEEGVKFEFLASPVKIQGKCGKITAIECIRMKLGEPDQSGRPRPVPVEGSEFTVEVDTVIPAVSQAPDLDAFGSKDLAVTKWKTLEVNPGNLSTNIPGVFAGGDAVSGPASAVEAFAAGNKAARYIEKLLNGESIEPEPEEKNEHVITLEDIKARMNGEITKSERVLRQHIPNNKRKTSFEEVEKVFTKEEALKEAARCVSCGPCSQCEACASVCGPNAIDYNMKDQVVTLNPAAVIVATGFDMWDPTSASEYGYKKYPNVYTAMEYERMINASGPTGGHIVRRSDGEHPKKLAFIQCVGSRNPQVGHPYCCSVCCMHATKEAMLAREHYEDINSTIFYKDMRACAKGFNEYVERAKSDYGVSYINSDATVQENAETHNPVVVFDVGGKQQSEEFDAVVLATTLVPRKDTTELAKKLGLKLTEFGFFESPDSILDFGKSDLPGIYLAGYCAGPADIPESVAQGSSAAAKAAEVLANSGGG
ncbi:MAG: NAD(P)-binding protein [Thermoplasmata archaeon]|nr:NAD(P)-binding protein [Thermoplasmata archaeon]